MCQTLSPHPDFLSDKTKHQNSFNLTSLNPTKDYLNISLTSSDKMLQAVAEL